MKKLVRDFEAEDLMNKNSPVEKLSRAQQEKLIISEVSQLLKKMKFSSNLEDLVEMYDLMDQLVECRVGMHRLTPALMKKHRESGYYKGRYVIETDNQQQL